MTPEEAMAAAQKVLDRDFADWHLGVFSADDLGLAFMCMFNTKKYLESGDPADTLGPSLGPIAVPKDGSEPWMLGSWGGFDKQIAEKLGAR